MSPLTRRRNVRRSGWSIKGSNQGFKSKTVKIEVEGDSVSVGWFDKVGSCATRSFTSAALRELILYVDGTLARYDDMWLNWKDSRARAFYIHLDSEGQLTGSDSARENGRIPWDDLKHAFEEALEELGAEEAAESTV